MVEAVFFQIFGISLFSAQLAVSVFYLALAWGTYVLSRRWLNPPAAFAVSLLFIGAPEVASWGRQIMLEIPTVAFLVWVAVVFFRYLDENQPKLLYCLALLLAASAYTKQTALFLVPVLILTLWRKKGRSMFRDRHLWWSAALLAGLVLPLVVWNLTVASLNISMVRGGDWAEIPVFSWAGWLFYLRRFPAETSWVITLLAAAALLAGAMRRKWWGEGDSFFVTWLATGYVLFSLIAVKDSRYAVFFLLPLAFFAVRFVIWVAPARVAPVLAIALAGVSFAYTIWHSPAPYVQGYGKAADWIAVHAPRRSVVVFSGYRDGSFIFDMRGRVDRPDLSVLRSDKLLLKVAQQRAYGLEELAVSEAETSEMMNRFGVSYVVSEPTFWDDLKNMQQFQHMLHSGQFRRVATIPISSNVTHSDQQLEIYENLGPVKADRSEQIRVELPIIGRQIEGTLTTDESGAADQR